MTDEHKDQAEEEHVTEPERPRSEKEQRAVKDVLLALRSGVEPPKQQLEKITVDPRHGKGDVRSPQEEEKVVLDMPEPEPETKEKDQEGGKRGGGQEPIRVEQKPPSRDEVLIGEESEDVIKIENVHKTYLLGLEGVAALRGVSVTIKKREFVCIFGTSGGGKTTLLNLIGTIDKPTKVSHYFASFV